MQDDRPPEQILAEIGNEARTAFNAELDFFKWRAGHENDDFPGVMKRYQQWLQAGEPFARSCARIAKEFPQHFVRLEEIVLPIQREIFGIE
ncbi:MAG: hypothetical protein J2P54_23880 [Bradyrhizobiaceae bacterium]|nr:hypothetical protein [Bradyrhizobiaceae bacterium]